MHIKLFIPFNSLLLRIKKGVNKITHALFAQDNNIIIIPWQVVFLISKINQFLKIKSPNFYIGSSR
jgi:hypothetical protein